MNLRTMLLVDTTSTAEMSVHDEKRIILNVYALQSFSTVS